jgi:uncharacterized protein (DUF39 family)
MAGREKSITSINKKIKEGSAVVLTEMEFIEEIRDGHKLKASDIDVVTTACCAETSGTAAMISVPVTGRGVFTRAHRIWLNGVLGYPGPAPNERLGLVESLVFASQPADDKGSNYNGARLFLDILRRKEIQAACLSLEGDMYETCFHLDEIEFARMYIYNCFFKKLSPEDKTSSKTSHLKTIRGGSKILLNKAPGVVIGSGTGSAPEHRALSIAADMFGMDPEDMKESETETGKGIKNSVGLAIPVITEGVLRDLAACLLEERGQKVEDSTDTSEKNTTEYLKQCIQKGEFLLISSDMYLSNWF